MESDKLRKLASMLDDYGRGGDTLLAHINPREAALLKALGGSGTINPKTGLLEFMDADGQGTSEAGAVGAGVSSDPGYGTVDTFGGDYGGKDEGDRARDAAAAAAPGAGPFGAATYDTHGYGNAALAGGRIAGQVGAWLGRQVDKAAANPFATGLNTMASLLLGPIGTVNTVSGWLGGPTIGGSLTSAARDVTGFTGTQTANASTNSSGNGRGNGGLLSGDAPGGNMPDYGPSGSSNSPLAAFANQQPSDVAREALSKALIAAPNAYNGWDGNQFKIGAYAQPQRSYGLLQSSYSPTGQHYVTPWGYR